MHGRCLLIFLLLLPSAMIFFYIHSWCFKCLAIQIMEYYLETPYPHVAFRDTIIYTTAELTSYSNMNVTRNDNDALLLKQLVLAALFTVTCIGWQKNVANNIHNTI